MSSIISQTGLVRQCGQAMAEYVVVLAFGVMVLTIGQPSPIEQLATVIQNNWRGYSYALSMSDIPDVVTWGEAQAQYLIDGGATSNLNHATNYPEMLDSITSYNGDLPDYCNKIKDIQLSDLANGPGGVGGGELGPINGC